MYQQFILYLHSYFQEKLASVYQELSGNELLNPVPFKILIEHPLIQDIVNANITFKALVSNDFTQYTISLVFTST